MREAITTSQQADLISSFPSLQNLTVDSSSDGSRAPAQLPCCPPVQGLCFAVPGHPGSILRSTGRDGVFVIQISYFMSPFHSDMLGYAR